MKSIATTCFALGLALGATGLAKADELGTMGQDDAMQTLQDIAIQEGLVRVIVSLALPADGQEEAGIVTVDQAKMLMQTALPMEDAPLVEPIEDQPLVVMEVTPRGLDWLTSSPMVARIEADGLTGIPPIETTPVTPDDDDPSFGGDGSGTGELSAPQSD